MGDASEDEIEEAFGCFGQIINLQMPLNRMTGYVKGYCMLEYREQAEAEAAIGAMNGKTMGGCTLDVSWLCQEPTSAATESAKPRPALDGDRDDRRTRSRSR